MKTLEQVSEFHKTFQHPILDSPQIPDTKRVDLRINLLVEEVKEFAEAARAGDIVGVADALCDIQYVLAGAVLEFGLKDKFPAMFNEVQRSNMSKACETEREAQETILAYLHEGHQDEMHYEERDGKFLVYRTKDRKTLKARFYSPADLKQFL